MRDYKTIVTTVTDICGVVVNIALSGNGYNTTGLSLKRAWRAGEVVCGGGESGGQTIEQL